MHMVATANRGALVAVLAWGLGAVPAAAPPVPPTAPTTAVAPASAPSTPAAQPTAPIAGDAAPTDPVHAAAAPVAPAHGNTAVGHAVPVGAAAPAHGNTAAGHAAPVGAAVPVGAVAPVTGPVVRPFEQPATAYGPGHRGVDLAASAGEPVRAAMAGVVRFAGSVAGERWVTVRHAGGVETTYGGVAAAVPVGARVALGQRLGTVRAGRRVLDWGARVAGAYIDPLGLLAGWRVRLVAVDGR